MSKYNFSASDVAKTIRAIATKRPDFVYTAQEERPSFDTGCSYLSAGMGVVGGEGCIVGQALSELGVSEKLLHKFEGKGASELVKQVVAVVSEEDLKTLIWIDNVQINQDTSFPWAMAVELADDE